jgi:hypothetical protein
VTSLLVWHLGQIANFSLDTRAFSCWYEAAVSHILQRIWVAGEAAHGGDLMGGDAWCSASCLIEKTYLSSLLAHVDGVAAVLKRLL